MKLIHTTKIKSNDVILIPIPKNFKGKEFYTSIKYADYIIYEKPNIENSKIIRKKTIESFRKSKLEDFNWTFFLNPLASDLVVLDFDDIECTERKIKFLRDNNPEFNLKWLVFQKELLEKTFSVRTPSGGIHYYIKRPSKLIQERKIGAIKVNLHLNGDLLKSYKEKFDTIDKKVDVIKIDYLPKGLVIAPGLSLKEINKKGFIQDRDYRILNNSNIQSVSEDLENILCYIFAQTEGKSKEEKKRRIIIKDRKEGSLDIDTIISETIKKEKELENIKGIILNTEQMKELRKKYDEVNKKLLNASEKDSLILQGYQNAYSYEMQEIEKNLKTKLENEIKELLCSNIETEQIFNINYKYDIASTLFNRNSEFHSFPPNLIKKVNDAKEGQRSEIEMAFITNLKVRNFPDTYIIYMVRKHFSKRTKCISSPKFLEQALRVGETLKHFPQYLNNQDTTWVNILMSISILRQIDFRVFSKRNSEKMRLALDVFFNLASINNDLEINMNLKEISLLSNGRINNKSLKEYLKIFEKHKIIENIEWMDYNQNRMAYPIKFTLKSLTTLKIPKKLDLPRFIPQDGNQPLVYIPSIGEKGMQIIELLRQHDFLSASEIYAYFTDIKDHRRVIYKTIQTLLRYQVVIKKNEKLELSGKPLNQIYEKFVNEKFGKKNIEKKERALNPLKRKITNYKQEAYFINKRREKG
ncbi:bifunctional DNA primase/polymerase, N-terminal domain protein [Leptospira ryugenii]|uniref:Bifunctional DNA primase/polymerase, N-terminal domain protein n=1 Tax=Leptospira ryugenii TaxID=1917863 RepID=A0A2P2DXS3_9LEPT|nr:hypothetical protein [Leptospira ryugenii]GBF49438.1 bifunctional DNA primase/polymerase, N-terminal domain protein [Leptospira ryugenii]